MHNQYFNMHVFFSYLMEKATCVPKRMDNNRDKSYLDKISKGYMLFFYLMTNGFNRLLHYPLLIP